MKPGFYSTEFWLSALKLLLGTFLIWKGHTSAGYLLLGIGGATSVHYSQGRQHLKEAVVSRPPAPRSVDPAFGVDT